MVGPRKLTSRGAADSHGIRDVGGPSRDAGGPSDAELLRRHVAGDSEAFGTLFSRHSGRLWAVALRTVGDPEDAADALQEAMISAFRRAGSFRGDSAVGTWLHRIVVNAAVDRLRRRPARTVSWPSDPDELEGFFVPRTADAVETRLDVDAALHMLPPEQRAALVLVDMMGYPVAEVATILGVSQGTVKSRCARGRARLLPYLSHLRGPQPHGSQPHGPQPRGDSPEAGNQPAADDVSPEQGGGG
jgi:RNA polymerase sigma-70 factor (ECF subfamily)